MSSSGMTGHSAACVVEGCTIAESLDFTLTCNQESVDLTSRDSSYWRELIVSTRSWSITGTFHYVAAAVGKKVLVEHWENQTTTTITTVLTFADGTVTATGEAILSSLVFTNPHAGAADVSFTLEGTAALAISAS